jgi:hypothetical protein
MGEVVDFESTPAGAKPQPGPGGRSKRRGSRSKTALVLGGGGFTGGVYEIGALRALDLLTVNRTVNDFDIYVGTSAGSFVASLVAAGVTPEEMSRVVNKRMPTPFRDIDLGTLLKPNYMDFATRSVLVPLRLAGLARNLAGRWREASLMDILTGLAEALPPGLYSGSGIESYVRRVFEESDRTDDFRLLEPELYLCATDLDTCSEGRAGMTFRSQRRFRRRRRCRWSTAPWTSRVASSSMAAFDRRPTSTSRSSKAPSSSSW